MAPVSLAIVSLAESFAGSLLANYVSRPVGDAWTPRDQRRAQDRISDVVADSLHPLFEREVPEDAAVLVLQQTESALKQCPLTLEFLAERNFQSSRIHADLLAACEPDSEIAARDLGGLYEKALSIAVQRALDIAPYLDDWERLSWDRNFAQLEKIEAQTRQVSDLKARLVDAPDRQAQTFEDAYRDEVCQANAKIKRLGIPVTEVQGFELDTSYVELSIARLSVPHCPDTDACTDGISLKEARERVESALREASPVPERPVDAILEECRRLVIIGTPGSGKTTLMQHLTCWAAKGQLREEHPALSDFPMPFLFRVRDLDFDHLPTPEQFVQRCAPYRSFACPEGFLVEAYLSEGIDVDLEGAVGCVDQHGTLYNTRPDNV